MQTQESILAARKQRASGKRVAIKGKYLLSTPEIYAKVLEAERNTKKKKRNRGIPSI